MTKYYTLLFFIFSLLSSAQDKILFSYDNAGNQTLREICINCNARTSAKPIKELKKEDLQEIDKISYYPNPVSEELYINWELITDKKVQSIKLVSLSGKILGTYLPENENMVIGFQNLPQGLYLIHLIYNTSEEKVLKIIKK